MMIEVGGDGGDAIEVLELLSKRQGEEVQIGVNKEVDSMGGEGLGERRCTILQSEREQQRLVCLMLRNFLSTFLGGEIVEHIDSSD